MEGILWKWTNYWNGWQTRWFVLDNGILSYYKSQEEVNQGCKGSVKVSVCQINVNHIDSTRMDLVIPGQQHMYLRAPSPQDRQKWLVALGSAKACVDSKGDSKGVEDPNSLGHKKSELRLYCDLLMQQVHAVKSAAITEGGPEVQWLPGCEKLRTLISLRPSLIYCDRHLLQFFIQPCELEELQDTVGLKKFDLLEAHDVFAQKGVMVAYKTLEDASSLLSATCDTFIRTLEDIMKLTSGPSTPMTAPYEMPIIPNLTMHKNGPSKSQVSVKTPRQSLTRSVSQENR